MIPIGHGRHGQSPHKQISRRVMKGRETKKKNKKGQMHIEPPERKKIRGNMLQTTEEKKKVG